MDITIKTKGYWYDTSEGEVPEIVAARLAAEMDIWYLTKRPPTKKQMRELDEMFRSPAVVAKYSDEDGKPWWTHTTSGRGWFVARPYGA